MSTHTRRLVFANHKGGVAKTTSAASVAAALAAMHQRVLAVDLDPQADLTKSLGLEGAARPRASIGHILMDPELNPHEGVLAVEAIGGLALLPATDYLNKVENVLGSDPYGQVQLLRVVDELDGDYDWIIIDTPANLGQMTLNGLRASQMAIIPSEPTVLSARRAIAVSRLVADVNTDPRTDVALLGVLLTMRDPRLRLTGEVRRAFEGQRLELLPVEIPRTVRVAEAPGWGKPITHLAPDSAPALAYYQLARWLQALPPAQPAAEVAA